MAHCFPFQRQDSSSILMYWEVSTLSRAMKGWWSANMPRRPPMSTQLFWL
jgi:hypothetical protein